MKWKIDMLNKKKSLVAMIGMFFATIALAIIHPGAAIIFAVLLFFSGMIGILKPLPRIGLPTRGRSALVMFFAVGLFGGAMDIWVKQIKRETAAQSAATSEQEAAAIIAEEPAVVERVETPEPVDPTKVAMVAKVRQMTESIASTIRQHYNIESQSQISNMPFCNDNGYCDIKAGLLSVQVFGAGIAVVETTDQVSSTDYIEMCAVVFAAISGADITFAGESVGLLYGQALQHGTAKQDVSGVQIKIAPSLLDIQGCRFFKY